MIEKPLIIDGDSFADERDILSFVNDFKFNDVNRNAINCLKKEKGKDMDRAKIGAYRASESLVFRGQSHKSLDVDKNLNNHCHWDKNITLECYRFCLNNRVHLNIQKKMDVICIK